jgi:hypothetical protein
MGFEDMLKDLSRQLEKQLGVTDAGPAEPKEHRGRSAPSRLQREPVLLPSTPGRYSTPIAMA